ncbi:MAG: isoprenoid biosynthesis glyoxalase ElbB [Prevotellaceae bacterium]|jgi:enhancing lycopene biosynthesis protein 2|nr:isoprenoid biosynthesis glyoxalase ElbB [Prevotellaceae bacterium]
MKKFAVILAGCGVFDGSEIHEATLTLLAIKKAGHDYQVFAPDIPQYHVINHLKGKVTGEQRNVLLESARIARRQAKPLSQFIASEYDAMVFPGGFGAAKNLCDYAFKGAGCTVNAEVEKAVKDMHAAGKPIGAMCIAPVILARIFRGSEVTVGAAGNDAANIEKMDARHVVTTHGEVVVDKSHKLYTTPCYMLDATIVQIAQGTENLINAMLTSM